MTNTLHSNSCGCLSFILFVVERQSFLSLSLPVILIHSADEIIKPWNNSRKIEADFIVEWYRLVSSINKTRWEETTKPLRHKKKRRSFVVMIKLIESLLRFFFLSNESFFFSKKTHRYTWFLTNKTFQEKKKERVKVRERERAQTRKGFFSPSPLVRFYFQLMFFNSIV